MLKSWFEKARAQAGFSLIELMVVVAIIGILAAIGVPQYTVFQAKAKQSEAKENLGFLYTLEQAYFGENSSFIGLTAKIIAGSCGSDTNLGFKPAGCVGSATTVNNLYSYETSNIAASTFTGTATAAAGKINPNSKNADIWTIDQAGTLKMTSDGTK